MLNALISGENCKHHFIQLACQNDIHSSGDPPEEEFMAAYPTDKLNKSQFNLQLEHICTLGRLFSSASPLLQHS